MKRAARLLATWFGAGYLPIAPGTWGSLGALPLAAALAWAAGGWGLVSGAVVIFALGLWATARFLLPGGIKDPSEIVIDEVAGQLLALAPVAHDPLWWPIAFILFRLADIVKPWPANVSERLPGALGVMADDAVAALYVVLFLSGSLWLMQRYFGG
ncbi:MAG: phosphatidylglycerophosphatase A [Alphaproteobacteria bacterium]|nr:phosphatidylglycerophosphatase A [Alphaproteobacteria bacterium]